MSLGLAVSKFWARFAPDMTPDMIHGLIEPSVHSPLVRRRRAQLILSRVRWVAGVFAVLTPLWIAVDVITFPQPLCWYLAALRLGASLCFGAVALGFRPSEKIDSALKALASLLAIPVVFFLISDPLLMGYSFTPFQLALAAGYAFLPFVMVAGLSVFPITALEGALFSAPLILSMVGVVITGYELLPFSSYLGALWLLGLLAVVATLAGISQLHFMMALVQQSSHDGLTKVYTRRVGEELLSVQFTNAERARDHLTLVFIDLDDFKKVNDGYGHEAGDHTLRVAADAMKRILRRGDIVVRWGGEEFLIIMPGTDLSGALIGIDRLRETGIGLRPDGTPQTASIGVAERILDAIPNWEDLVEVADRRMYMAKKNGKNRVICADRLPEATQAHPAK